MAQINLNSQTAQHAIRAVPTDSTLTCVSTSGPDVYVGGVTSGSPVHNLSPGDSMLALKGTLSVYLFRKSSGPDATYSAVLDIEPLPAKPSLDQLAMAMDEVVKPRGPKNKAVPRSRARKAKT